jgi:streptogramin lyase
MRRSTKQAVAAVFLASTMPALAQTPTAITLSGERLHPESVSISSDGHAYVGGMQGGVQRISLKTGKVDPFVKSGDFASGSIFGVLADTVNGVLWACSNPDTPMSAKIAGADPTSVLKGFDLKTGKGRYSLPLPGNKPMCNDMAVARDGTLYVTDTTNSHILRFRKGATALEDWHHDTAYATGTGSGLDGIALGGDGHLYVNNWQSNIMARVEVKPDGSAGKTTLLTPSQPLAMPDGLRAIGGLRFVQAESRGKVTIVTVEGDKAQVEVVKEGLSSPTSADLHDGTIWYVEAEFSYFFDPTKRDKTPPPFKLTPIAAPAAPHAHHH